MEITAPLPHKAAIFSYRNPWEQTVYWYALSISMAIPHKDCATDASSNFSSDETKSGVNT